MTQKQKARFWVREYMDQVIPGLYEILQGHSDEQYKKYIIDQLSTPMLTEYRDIVRMKYIASCMEHCIHKMLQSQIGDEGTQDPHTMKSLKDILYTAISRW